MKTFMHLLRFIRRVAWFVLSPVFIFPMLLVWLILSLLVAIVKTWEETK